MGFDLFRFDDDCRCCRLGWVEFMQIQSSIEIKRNKKWADIFRSYQIILDGESAGVIDRDRSISIVVNPGHHSLKMKLDWCGSKELNFNISPGEKIMFECENNRSSPFQLLLLIYYIIFETDRWILLKRCD
jgi:hypothetical protein